MSKYYTPEIEEFFIGFEFERKIIFLNLNELTEEESIEEFVNNPKNYKKFSDKGIWKKYSYTKNIDLKEYEEIRVKYLDREDIESLGFTYLNTTIDNHYEIKVTRDRIMSAHTNRRYTLSHDFRTNQGVVIREYAYESGTEGEDTVYRGKCKNKSELKRILKQIGI